MIKLFDRVKVNIPTTGTGDIEFGAAASTAFLTPTEAGVLDGDEVRYVIVDGLDFEEGVGLIKDTVATMERSVTKSKIGGVVGTSALNLSGTAVLALTASAADILTPDDNLASVEDADTALDNLGGTAVGKAVFTAVDQAAAQAAIGAKVLAGHLYGMEMTWVSGTAIGFSTGECADSSASHYIKAASAIAEKYIHVAWAAGTAQGMLDAGTVADGTYHIFAIGKSTDAAAFDYLASISPTAPAMPATWDLKRRIGSILRRSGAILPFWQSGGRFMLATNFRDAAASNTGTSAVLLALTVPTGISVDADIALSLQDTGSSARTDFVFSSPLVTDIDPATMYDFALFGTSGNVSANSALVITTNTSGQIRYRASRSGASTYVVLKTRGWIDGRLA